MVELDAHDAGVRRFNPVVFIARLAERIVDSNVKLVQVGSEQS